MPPCLTNHYDAVLVYHTNPLCCGVTKFSMQLAERLGVPCLRLSGLASSHPLISIKASELEPTPWYHHLPVFTPFDLLLHDRPAFVSPEYLGPCRRVFYADVLGCPSTLQGNPARGLPNVLLFGMSHKITKQPLYLERLRDLLTDASPRYTVSVSTAVHEGHPWDEAFTTTVERLRAIFTDHLRVLGYLADDGLALELQSCSAAALFFDPAARANNTTLWAAMEAACPVVTNLDAASPSDLIHDQSVFDIMRLTEWPRWPVRTDVATGGREVAKAHNWDRLLEALRA